MPITLLPKSASRIPAGDVNPLVTSAVPSETLTVLQVLLLLENPQQTTRGDPATLVLVER
jgi:hypothetical protein